MTYSTDMKSRIRRLYCFVALAGTLSAPLAEAAEDRSWVERSDRISALGPRFDQRQFHDLVIAQGLLPPGLLERTVLEELTRRYPGTSRTPASPGSAGSRPPTGAQAR